MANNCIEQLTGGPDVAASGYFFHCRLNCETNSDCGSISRNPVTLTAPNSRTLGKLEDKVDITLKQMTVD